MLLRGINANPMPSSDNVAEVHSVIDRKHNLTRIKIDVMRKRLELPQVSSGTVPAAVQINGSRRNLPTQVEYRSSQIVRSGSISINAGDDQFIRN